VSTAALHNDGSLEVVFLGVGSAFAVRNYQTNVLIVKGDEHVLIDCGSTAHLALRQLGLAPTDIHTVLPTHSHADHVGGLEHLALLHRYVGDGPKPRLIITEAYENVLWEQTLRGGLGWNEPKGLTLGDYFELLRPEPHACDVRETHRIRVGDIQLELFRTCHIPEYCSSWREAALSYGVFVDDRVFICSDTRFDPDLLQLYADRAEIFFHDIDFGDGAVHASLGELRTLPEAIRSRMHVVHYPDSWESQDLSAFGGLTQPATPYRFPAHE
jgi:ribonuclease BN (tRNA processing enzyme)